MIPLGKKPRGTQNPHRDAVHVAICLVKATCRLMPGEPVSIVTVPVRPELPTVAPGGNSPVGVVDPFLTTPVEEGEEVYVALYPETTKNLRHHWDHPQIPEIEPEPEYDDDEDDDGCRGC